MYQDARLLVSELVTVGAEFLDERAAPQVELSIGRTSLRVELRYEGAGADTPTVDTPAVGEWTRMLLDALTSRWGTSAADGVFLWFELQRA